MAKKCFFYHGQTHTHTQKTMRLQHLMDDVAPKMAACRLIVSVCLAFFHGVTYRQRKLLAYSTYMMDVAVLMCT